MRISVVIPTYNEAQSIGRVLADIPGMVEEVLVVDRSANPDPDMPPLTKEDKDDVTDRKLAAIHFANRNKHQP